MTDVTAEDTEEPTKPGKMGLVMAALLAVFFWPVRERFRCSVGKKPNRPMLKNQVTRQWVIQT